MTMLESLEEYAMDHDINVYRHLPLDKDSCSVKVKGKCAIAVAPLRLTRAEETVCMAHELGHCETDPFIIRPIFTTTGEDMSIVQISGPLSTVFQKSS